MSDANDTGEALSERDQAVLTLERRWWASAGAKDHAIRDELGMSTTQYYQVLSSLLDSPAALAFDPTLVARLGRMREARRLRSTSAVSVSNAR
ncbi:DUF3263 domain-containing protein [Demequina sediminicola]|uniref:DUF3263 domain-containing protein n=1 Tax=Demequina sediminicola TaxID=1095026 RepID=UPI0009E32B27|nr:DUF3263 domain-containing protein [Demequina sediminicola]